MPDDPRETAFNQAAPESERLDAMTQLQRTYAPSSASSLIPPDDIQRIIDHIDMGLEGRADMAKAGIVVPFPGRRDGKVPTTGMRSVSIDEQQTTVMGDYIDKPNALNLEPLRDLVLRTPLLSSIVQTRIRQVSRFAQPSEDGGLGFSIQHEDPHQTLQGDDAELGRNLTKFFKNCGWEFNPRKRVAMKRDSFTQFMAKSTWDTLALDAAPIETEMRRGRDMGLDGFYSVDGTTVRLCTEQGYQGDDEIFALQVLQGRVATTYTHDQLVYQVRNPRSDVRVAGYGMAEPELMVRIITGWLNALSYNISGFDQNAIPKGLLHITGNYGEADLVAFKRQWNMMVKGVNNAWAMPIMVSKDQESRVAFEKFGVEFDEMMFSKWMTLLTSVACAIYAISPDEINFASFSPDKSSLSGSDTEAKLTQSKDKGLRPLLSYYEAMFTDFFVADFSDHLCFRFVGLDEQDPKQKWEEDKTALCWGELRKRRGDPPLEDPSFESMPINPTFIGPWQAKMQAQQQAEQAQQQQGQDQPDYGQEGAGDFGGGDDDQAGGDDDDVAAASEGAGDAIDNGSPDVGAQVEGDFGKALRSAIYRLGE